MNAYTWYDETCYNLDNVPTVNPSTIDTALLILHDWSQFISLEPVSYTHLDVYKRQVQADIQLPYY